jgi:hypothetical protein
MAIDLENRIIYMSDADGNQKFAEVRQYEQFTALKAVLALTKTELEFTFEGLDDSNKERWSVEIDGVPFEGTFSGAVEVTNTGLFSETIKKPKTKRLDIS